MEAFEQAIEKAGIAASQTHLLSKNYSHIEQHQHLNPVTSFMKRDVVHSTIVSALLGLLFSLGILLLAFLAGWTNTAAGWFPFLFLSVSTLGFFTWMGGLHGIQTPNHQFTAFIKTLIMANMYSLIDASYAHETD